MKWPELLVIVRHGQSELNVARDLEEVTNDPSHINRFLTIRDLDVQLTEEGKRQASETGKYLKRLEFDAVFSSPYLRCKQTAEEITRHFASRVSLYYDNRIREKEFGWIHGLTTDQIKERFPNEHAAYHRDGKYWYRPPGGENYPDVEQRVHMFLDKLHRDYAEKNVLVVTHAVPFLLFRALFEHLGEEDVLRVQKKNDVKNCGIALYLCDTAIKPEGKMNLQLYNLVVY